MKIDRNIRKTRSKEESRKAHVQAVITAVCFVVLWIILKNVQSAVLKGVSNTSPILAMILSLLAGIILVAAVMCLLYKVAKGRNKKTS